MRVPKSPIYLGRARLVLEGLNIYYKKTHNPSDKMPYSEWLSFELSTIGILCVLFFVLVYDENIDPNPFIGYRHIENRAE